MKNRISQSSAQELLIDASQEVADRIYDRAAFPNLWLWEELECFTTQSGGWAVELGGLKSKSTRLEIWIDMYSRVGDYRLYAGYAAGTYKPLEPIVRSAPPPWSDALVIKGKDVELRMGRLQLREPLEAGRFGSAIVEHLWRGDNYFGVYDPISPADPLAKTRFCRLAVPFFRETLGAVEEPVGSVDAVSEEDFPGVFERRRVYRHVRFERSTKHAAERKRKDGYVCKVCDLNMADMYGEYGDCFAEAHHKEPLHTLERETVVTLESLLTVCPNCHRMLHKMDGKRDDWEDLRDIVRSRRTG